MSIAALFWCCLIVFALTALIALLDISDVRPLRDHATRKWLRVFVLGETIAVILSLFKLLFLSPGDQVWTVYGVAHFDRVVANLRPENTTVSIAPPPFPCDTDGKFEATVIATKTGSGKLKFPKLLVAAPGCAPRTLDFSDAWADISRTNDVKWTKVIEDKAIHITTPIILAVERMPYDRGTTNMAEAVGTASVPALP